MYDVIIVGGGISGLYCAIHLNNVLVLEASNSWGGKIKKHYHPNYEGAGRFHKKHTLLWNLIKRFRLTPQSLTHQRTTKSLPELDCETLSVEDYLIQKMKRSPLHQLFYDRCVEVMGESDAVQFVYAKGYHEMCFLDAYDSLHSFDQSCHESFDQSGQEYYVLKEGLMELCSRMVKVVKGNCQLNHSVKTILRVDNHVRVDGYEGTRVIVTIPPHLFHTFPLLSPYDSTTFNLGPPLLRIYVKYPTPWFETIDYKHWIPMHDGMIVMVYVKEEDILKFTYQGNLRLEPELRSILNHELSTLFPCLDIPVPLWIKPYLWIGQGWLPARRTLPEIESILVCGEAFSTRPRWIEGALESAESILEKIISRSQ